LDVTRLRILSLPFLNYERLNPEFSLVISKFCSGLFHGESYLSWQSIALGEVVSLGENFSDFLVRALIRVRYAKSTASKYDTISTLIFSIYGIKVSKS
jgi:hypothetical protein